jgi:lipid-A-disaccharide synthase
VEIIKKKYPDLKFYIAGMEKIKDVYSESKIEVKYNMNFEQRKIFDIAISVSGTTNMENALIGIPMVVVYRLPYWTYLLIKSMIHVKYISIVNLIAGGDTLPELIQNDDTPENISAKVIEWIENKNKLLEIRQKYMLMRKLLGSSNAYSKAAGIVSTYLS